MMAVIASSTPSIPVGEHVQAQPAAHRRCSRRRSSDRSPGAVVLVLAVGDARVSAPRAAPRSRSSTRPAAASTASPATLRARRRRPSSSASSCTGESERIQRREWVRVEATLPVSVKGIDEPVGGDTVTLNISGGGVLVKDPWNMPLGIDVRIELEVEPGSHDPALGRVVREPAPDQKGVRIDSIGRERPRAARAPRPRARARRPAHVEGPMRQDGQGQARRRAPPRRPRARRPRSRSARTRAPGPRSAAPARGPRSRPSRSSSSMA